MKNKWEKTIFYSFLLLVLLLLMAMSYTIGTVSISKVDAIQLVFSKLPIIRNFVSPPEISSGQITILLNLRLPRVLLSFFCGGALAVVGAVFQGIFSNPLAEPYVLGVSSGASLGATIALILFGETMFFSFSTTSIFASVGAILTVFLVLTLSSLHGGKMSTMLLTGIAFSYFASSVSTILMVLNEDKIASVTLWSIGSFTNSSWDKVKLVIPALLIGLAILFFFYKELNALSLGEELAISLGVPLITTRYILITVSTIMVAVTVASSGIIGFVGLIVPSFVRMITGSNYKSLLPTSFLVGGIFLITCDTVARLLNEIPAGAITALIGTPIFIFLAIKYAKGQVA